MSAETTGDMSLKQDEDLRKMWQETDDFGKKKEIRSHMYKVREARLKDFYNAGEETTSSSENRQHSSSTMSTTRSSNTGLKGSDLMMHADNLADHSFLSLKSKEIRDSESPTKDSYKITETRKISDRDWNIIETNEASKDGKMHTTTRLATTAGKQDLDGGELNYDAKSQHKASVYRDGDDKNFTKATEASSQNVIKQEAFGGDDNSKFYSTSTTSTSTSKFSSEQRSTTDDFADRVPIRDPGDTRHQKVTTTTYRERPSYDSTDATVVRKVYTENIPNEFKNHPNYSDGNTKVTTETKTLPDGSTVTTTRYETKGGTQYSTSSSTTSSSSKRHVSSSDQNNRNVITSHVVVDDVGRDFDDRASIVSDSSVHGSKNTSSTTKVTTSKKTESKSFVDSSNVIKNDREDRHVSETDVRRIHDASLIGRDTKNVQKVDVHVVRTHELQPQDTENYITTVTKDIETPHRHRPIRETNNTENVIVKTFTIPTQDSHSTTTTTTKVSKTVSSKYDKQQVASDDFINVERKHIIDTKTETTDVEKPRSITSGKEPTREVIEITKEIKSTAPRPQPVYDVPIDVVKQPRGTVEVEIVTTKEEYVKKDEPKYVEPSREPIKDRKPSPEMVEIEIIPPRERPRKDEPKYEQPDRRQPIRPGKSEFDERPVPTEGQYDTTYRSHYVPKRISVDVSPTHDAFARSLRSISPDRISKTGSVRSLRTTSTTSLRSTSSPDRHPGRNRKTSPVSSQPTSPSKKSKSPEKHPCVDIVTQKRHDSPEKKSPEKRRPETPEKKSPTKYSHITTVTKKRPESPEKKSPEKYPHVDTVTKRRPESPEKKLKDYTNRVITAHTRNDEHITKQTNNTHVVNTDTITRRKKTTHDETEVDNSTLTRKKQLTQKPRSRSVSPTSVASDIEFIKHDAEIVTDLDVDETNKSFIQDTKLNRRHTEELDQRSKIVETTTDTRKLQKVTDKSATLPLPDVTTKKTSSSPNKDFPKSRSPTKEPIEQTSEKGKPKSIRRTDTYQQRCEEILGISDGKDNQRKSSLPNIPRGTDESPTKVNKDAHTPTKDIRKSPEKQKPSGIQEFPSQTRQSPSKEPHQSPADKIKSTKHISSPDSRKPDKPASSVQEFPSQIRKSPVKEPLEPYPEKPKGDKSAPSVQEFPSQIRKSPMKEPIEPYPEKPKGDKSAPSVQEFPSQTRKSPVKEPLEPYPEKPKGDKFAPSVQEFPSQTRKSPVKEPLEPYPEKPKSDKSAPSVQEFPSQTRKLPVKEPLEPYPEKPKGDKSAPSVQEFPSQIRKSPVKEPLEPYPEKPKGDKSAPSVQEFPSQTRKSTVKEPLEPYPEKPKGDKSAPSVQEFPSQIKKSPVKEPLEPYPEKPKGDKSVPSVQEFPSQTRKSLVKEPLEPYPEKPKSNKSAPSVQEFPSQTKKSPAKEPLEPYPEKPKGDKSAPSVQEFPSQTRKSPVKEPLEPYPERSRMDKQAPTIQEFPSQIKRPIQKEPLEPYPEKQKDVKQAPSVQEFPSQIRSSVEREPLEPYPEKPRADKDVPTVQEFPSQTKRSPVKEPTASHPNKSEKKGPTVQDIPAQVKKSPVKEYPEYYPKEPTELLDKPLEKSTHKVSLDDLPSIKQDKVSLDDIPSATRRDRKSPEKISLHDLDYKPGEVVDHFITNEKVDTEITLKKYKDGSIHRPRGIPDTKPQEKTIKETKKVVKKTRKDKTSVPTGGDETESTTDEEENIDDLEDQIIDDICELVECENRKITDEEITKVKTTQQTSSPVKQKPETDKNQTSPTKSKPKAQKPRQKPVEDFITVTKADLLQSESRIPVEEPINTKKLVKDLYDDEEEATLHMIINEKETITKNISSSQSAIKPNKVVKKDNPDKTVPSSKLTDKKKQTELLIKKEKLDTNIKSKPDTRRPEAKISPKGTPKKTPDESKITPSKKDTDRKVYQTEYTDEYGTTKDKKVSKITTRVSTPVKQTKKTVPQGVPNTTDITKDTKFHVRTERIDTTTKRTINVAPLKQNQVEKKPIAKLPASPHKKPDDQQPKQPSKLKTVDVKQPRTIVRTTLQKTVEVQPTKRHVVSTIINIKPKVKPESITKTIHKTVVTKTINAPKTTKATPKSTKPKQKTITNGHISSEEEESDTEYLQVKDTKRVTERVTPIRKSPFTKPSDSGDKRKHCITTKSILIENAVADQREIIVDLKRSKSSREGTPDRICPYPVGVDADLGSPRYPDRVTEPDDGTYHTKPKRVSDVPISETEDVAHFDRIREVTEDSVRTTKTQVERTDECLLSVNEKVSKFLSTAEQITKKPLDAKPAPKVERPKLEVDDTLKEDECLLSVSDKVQKFLTTAEQLTTSTKDVLQRPKSPKPKDTRPYVDDEDDTPRRKVEKDAPRPVTDETVRKPKEVPNETTEPSSLIKVEKTIITRRSVSPEKKIQPSQLTSHEPQDHPGIDVVRYKTPDRKPSDSYTKKPTEEIVKMRKDSIDDDSTPKTSRRLSKDEPKTVLSPTGRLRSTETIKKAKALFENIGKDQDIARQKDILNRPSVFEGRKLKKTEEVTDEKKTREVRTKLTYEDVRRSPSPVKQPQTKIRSHEPSPDQEIPHYMTPLDRSIKEPRRERKDYDKERNVDSESVSSRSTSPDRNIPHYMLPLDRTVREKSPHKENLKQLEDIMNKSYTTTHSDEVDISTTKFGVTLKRTDSGRLLSSHRKTSTSSIEKHSTEEIEEIFELEYLEKLLETIVGYDIRRRIRSQIRLVKRAIEENSLENLIISRRVSPTKDSPKRQPFDRDEPTSHVGRYSTDRRKQAEEISSKQDVTITQTSEYKSSYQRKASSEISTTIKSSSPMRDASPKKLKDKSASPDRKSKTPEAEPIERKSSTTTTTTSRIFQTDLKKAKPVTKTVVEEKPEWVTQRTLRKVSETSAPVKKTVIPTVKKTTTPREENVSGKPTDVITSSYGVGPTDENGAPLFGLKALRTQHKSEKTKVQGTVIRSQYYSENGEEPQGEISVTNYSTDPSDLGTENVIQDRGIASVTTTQKFGYKGTPSLKTVAGKAKKSPAEEEYKSNVKTTKVTRRGSVKEISQKFIENAVDTLKNERQSSYPKAGLILRTSSFKDSPSNDTDSSREGSPATHEVRQKTVTTVESRTTTSGDKKAESFLTNKTKVTGVQDAISRMKTQDVEIEESEEDAEARNLLNKFIGSQVLLSGMESHSSKAPVTVTAVPSGSVKTTTKITTTTTSSESSKPTTVTRTFTHPITAELLQTVWDEQTLKLLLEQSTDYEDRRIIRARLREVMAEQEACAELVEKASDDVAIKESGSTVHGTTTRTYAEGPVTSTSQVTTRISNQQQQIKKPMSPFAKFRQLDKQNSLNSPPRTSN